MNATCTCKIALCLNLHTKAWRRFSFDASQQPMCSALVGQYGTAVPHWYQKYAWGLKFMQWGYTCNFFETGKTSTSCLVFSFLVWSSLVVIVLIHSPWWIVDTELHLQMVEVHGIMQSSGILTIWNDCRYGFLQRPFALPQSQSRSHGAE